MKDTTTIQVERATVKTLEIVKKKYGVSSYDRAIKKLAEKEVRVPKSMFGAHSKMKRFERIKDDFHDL